MLAGHRARARGPGALSAGQPVDLRRHDEVVAAEAGRRVRVEPEGRAAPLELDLGMVALGLGEERYSRHEAEGAVEVIERELAAQRAAAVALPGGPLAVQLGGLPPAPR